MIWSLLTKGIFQENGQNLPVANLLIFCSQSWEIHYQSHSLHNFWFFFLYFGFLPLLEKFAHGFFSVLEAIIQKNCNKQPRIENGEGFAIHLSTWLSGTKGKDVSAADWLYQTHVKKYNCFSFYVSCYSFSQGWKSLNSTIVNVINYTLNLLAQAILRNIDPRTVLTQAQINIILK